MNEVTDKKSIHDLARALLWALINNPGIELPEYQDFKDKIAAKLDEMGVNRTVGVPTSAEESLVCVFEDGVLKTFEILQTIYSNYE